MSRIGDYIKMYIKEDGRTIKGVSKKLKINYKTFTGKLNRDSLSADELFKISELLNISLDQMRKDLDYRSIIENKYIYAIIDDLNEFEIQESESIRTRKLRVCDDSEINCKKNINIKHIFVQDTDSSNKNQYKLQVCDYENLKDTGIVIDMIRKTDSDNFYIKNRTVSNMMSLNKGINVN